MVARACSKCGALKVPAEFHRAKRYALGRRRECPDCIAVRRADYYNRNGERERAGMARWRERNYRYDRQRQADWYARVNGENSAAHRARLEARWASTTKRCNGCGLDKPKTEFHANRARKRSGEPLHARCKACWRVYTAARRARMMAAHVEPVDFAALLAEYGMVCHLCGEGIAEGDLHWDHVVPLSRGGEHSMVNLRPAHARCNLSKGARLVGELRDAIR